MASLQVQTSYRQIIKIAAPIALAMLVPQFNFIINNIFLGHYDTQALSAAGITGVYYLIFSSIGFGLNNGLQALISRRAGENKPDEIGKIFNQGVLISLAIAAAGIVLTWTVAPVIFRAAIRSNETYLQAVSFLRIRIWGLPFLFIYQMRNALLVGINKSSYLVIGTVAETAANVFFDYSLIFGHSGLPKLGFNGAAIASVIAEFTGMIVIFLVISSKGIAARYALFRQFRFDKVYLRKITGLSGPLVFQHGISIISWVFFYLLVEHHGQLSLAVSNAMRNIIGLFGISHWAFAATSNSMVSNLIGQGKKEEVIKIIGKITSMSSGIAMVVCLLLNLFPDAVLSVYGQGADFTQQGIPVVRVLSVAMLFMSAGTVWLNAVTGTGNSRVTFLIELAAIIAYCLYVYIVLEVKRYSIVWGWMSELLYWNILFVLSFAYIRSHKWQKRVL